jgi:hypothetical protein
MGRKPVPTEDRSVQLGIRLEPDQIADIDEAIADLQRDTGVEVTRSHIIRAWINEVRDRRRSAKRKK